QGSAVQGLARGVRRRIPDPRLSRGRAGDRMGAIRRGLPVLRRGQGNRARTRAHRRLFPVLPADALVHGAGQDQTATIAGDMEMRTFAMLILLSFASVAAGTETSNILAPATV